MPTKRENQPGGLPDAVRFHQERVMDAQEMQREVPGTAPASLPRRSLHTVAIKSGDRAAGRRSVGEATGHQLS